MEEDDLPAEVRDWEPPLALFSGEDGMAAINGIVRGAASLLEPGGLLALEIDSRRAGTRASVRETDSRFRDVEIRTDLYRPREVSRGETKGAMMLNERAGGNWAGWIGQSTEYQAVKRANAALNEDKAAMALLQKMEGLRTAAQQMIERGEQPTPEMEQELDMLLSEVQTNDTYQRVIVTNENFDKVMVQVNQWILDGMRKGAASPIITLG